MAIPVSRFSMNFGFKSEDLAILQVIGKFTDYVTDHGSDYVTDHVELYYSVIPYQSVPVIPVERVPLSWI